MALAAIQGLHQKLEEKDAEIAKLRAEMEAIRAMVAGLASVSPPSHLKDSHASVNSCIQ